MIFVTLGSQKFQFNRLLKQIDDCIAQGIMSDKVIAQIGYSTYVPQKYEYIQFMDRELFTSTIDNSDIIITHGGTGVIVNAIKKGKKVIAVPRLAQYGEHVDDHQLQLLHQFDELGLICVCYDLDRLGEMYRQIGEMTFNKYVSNTKVIIQSIEEYLDTL